MSLKTTLKELVLTMAVMSPFALFCASCTVKAVEWQYEQNAIAAEKHRMSLKETEAKPIYINCHPDDDIDDECYPVSWETSNEN